MFLRKCVPFGGHVDIALYFGGQMPSKRPFYGAGIAVFKPYEQNIQTSILSKPLQRLQPNFCVMIEFQNTLCGSSQKAPHKCNMADGCRLVKNNNNTVYLSNCVTIRSTRHTTSFCTKLHLALILHYILTVKYLKTLICNLPPWLSGLAISELLCSESLAG